MLWSRWDSVCWAGTSGAQPEEKMVKEIKEFECVPMGYSGYLYSYVCTDHSSQTCFVEGADPGCPAGGCALPHDFDLPVVD